MMFPELRPIKEADTVSRSYYASSAMVNLGYTLQTTGMSFVMSLKFLDNQGLPYYNRRQDVFD